MKTIEAEQELFPKIIDSITQELEKIIKEVLPEEKPFERYIGKIKLIP